MREEREEREEREVRGEMRSHLVALWNASKIMLT